MTILAQHGWGKSDKIETALTSGAIQGVIMSPRDETPGNLASFLSSIRVDYPSAELLADPLFHIGTVRPVHDIRLPQYPHYTRNLTPLSFSAANIQRFVGDTLSWQRSIEVSAILSPTVMVEDLNSRWAQIAMMLAQETVNQHDGAKPLLISLVVGEDALRQQGLVDSWLDDLTLLDVDGFYLVVRRASEDYRQHHDPEVLASLLRVCYSLAELNKYRVIAGYTDMVTLLLHAVGVSATGAGWYVNLKQFSLRRFQPSTGGRRARPRYSSTPLLNSIYITELDSIFNVGQIASVLSGTQFDTRFSGVINPENVPWSDNDRELHHWQVLADISQSPVGSRVGDRLDSARNLIAMARAVYLQLETMVPFATATGSAHLDQWLDALSRFRADVGV